MAEMGGDEARGEQQLFGEERQLLQARRQEREHNSSLRSGRSHGMRGPRMPGLGLRYHAALSSSPHSLSQVKGGSHEEREYESLSRLETFRLFFAYKLLAAALHENAHSCPQPCFFKVRMTPEITRAFKTHLG